MAHIPGSSAFRFHSYHDPVPEAEAHFLSGKREHGEELAVPGHQVHLIARWLRKATQC